MHDPHDPGSVAEQESRARAELEIRKDAWRSFLALPGGDRVVAELLRQSCYFEGSHTPGDPLHTAYKEGMRAMGAEIFRALMVFAPGRWPQVAALLNPPAE